MRRETAEYTAMMILGVWVLLLVFCTPTQAKAAPMPLGTISHLAWEASIRHGLTSHAADRLVCIAWYESRYDPSAVSYGAYYHGMMQFGHALWRDQAPILGYTSHISGSYDPYAAMDVAAYIVSRGGWYHWQPVVNGWC